MSRIALWCFLALWSTGVWAQTPSLTEFHKRLAATPENLQVQVIEELASELKKKIRALEKEPAPNIERIDLLALQFLFEPLVTLAKHKGNGEKCERARLDMSGAGSFSADDDSPSQEVRAGLAIVDLFCLPPTP